VTGPACTQPGCTGHIEDGYCDVCGSPAGAPVGTAPSAGSVPTTAVAPGAHAAPADSGSARVSSASARSSYSLGSAPIGSARTQGTRATRRAGTTSTRLRGSRLGAGLTTVPPVPAIDPQKAILANPEVPEDKRFCSSCGAPVGRSRDGQAGRSEGFCPRCRAPFSFSPKLVAGDIVGGQYQVAGALAHGGLGWIYLARDRNVSDRWVVLKGLLNAGDADAYAAAVAERQFLAQVEHPLIVEIYNFVLHEGAGYIVMEYVGGTSLKQILKERMQKAGGRYDAIPVDQAIAFVVEILPAFQYLHDLGLLYCDFKPDNMIQIGDAVKLIDLGGVRRADDTTSAIYGTVGYQAPEVPDVGPSIASDIYTVGRTLAVLAMEFRGYQSTYVATLPPVADTPLFQRYDSLYRLLAKACAPAPDDRFASADEMRVQLLGVLREVVAAADPQAVAQHSVASVLFDAPSISGDRLEWGELPALRVDAGDPMATWLAGLTVTLPAQRLAALEAAPQQTVEVRLALARAALMLGDRTRAEQAIAAMLSDDPWEWRAVWTSGLGALAADDVPAARAAFNAVYGQVPGELAPKLALALACELSGEGDVAETLYVVCESCDANYIAPSAFGLTRIRAQRGDLTGALDALDRVPPTSRSFVESRRQRAELLSRKGAALAELAAALDSVDQVTLDPVDRARLTVRVLDSALRIVIAHGARPDVTVAGHPATQNALRDGLEEVYRHLSEMTEHGEERVHLVDAANKVRRWTWR
jgi:serine/threonine-protein kinase PknG